MTDRPEDGLGGRSGSFVDWLVRRELLRGPFLFTDYWSSVLRMTSSAAEMHAELGLVDPVLFRLGLDRPDLEIPRLRYYVLLFLAGPFVFPFRFFRRLGKYRIRFRSRVGEEILRSLQPYRLQLRPTGSGRVNVQAGQVQLATDVLDPYRIAGFSSLFYAAYKLPVAVLLAALFGLLGSLAVGMTPILQPLTAHLLIASPLLVLALYLVFRDWSTSVLGALPVLIALYLLQIFRLDIGRDWLNFFLPLAGLLVLFLLVDWFFLPRPVPPVLMLYANEGPGKPYDREGDEPYWLEGKTYWVWRYLMLTPAEVNKFWERDWERLELWIRADGPDAGMLEWVVTDGHYRELWHPYSELGPPTALARLETEVRRCIAKDTPGLWLLEADADPLVHTPHFRVLSFLPEDGRIPVHGVGHLVRALFTRIRKHDPEAYRSRLEEARLRHGLDLLDDVPELVARIAARHLLSQPWRFWRYPLGANRRRQDRLYDVAPARAAPLAADPELQIKQEEP